MHDHKLLMFGGCPRTLVPGLDWTEYEGFSFDPRILGVSDVWVPSVPEPALVGAKKDKQIKFNLSPQLALFLSLAYKTKRRKIRGRFTVITHLSY